MDLEYKLIIKKMRKERKITQRQLADMVGISQCYLSGIERNKYDIQLSLMIKIAQALDLHPRDLYER